MYERYTQEARRAIFFSDQEARRANSASIEAEHLLLGLTHEANNKANQLFSLAAFAEQFRRQLELPIQEVHPRKRDAPSLSNAGKRVLNYALEEADQLESVPIGTEHLLLGLLREKKSDVPEALAAVGIDLHSARNRIRQECNLPPLEREPEQEADREIASRKLLRPFAAFLLLVLVLLLIYLIVRLVFS
jgi:ATP-dependent Clp protease ATP-binding subunit ClpC